MSKRFFYGLFLFSFFINSTIFSSQSEEEIQRILNGFDRLVIFNHSTPVDGLKEINNMGFFDSNNQGEEVLERYSNLLKKCGISYTKEDVFYRVVPIEPEIDTFKDISIKSYDELVSHVGRKQVKSFPVPASFLYKEDGKLKEKVILAGKELKVIPYDFPADQSELQTSQNVTDGNEETKGTQDTPKKKLELPNSCKNRLENQRFYLRVQLAIMTAIFISVCWLAKDTPMFKEMLARIK